MQIQEKNKIKKYNQGITLIALVISIIVILILAGVTIAALTGENGILVKTIGAKEMSDSARAMEKVKIEVAGSYGLNGKIDINLLNQNLQKKGITYNNMEIDSSEITKRINKFPAIVKVDNYDIEIFENGKTDYVSPYIKSNQVLYLDAIENYKKYGNDSNIWYDLSGSGKNASKTNGVTQWNDMSLILDGSTYYTVDAPVKDSYGTVEVCVKIDPSFEPLNTNSWFGCSTIWGCELTNAQKDWSIIIDKNGYFAIGYSFISMFSSNIYAKDGKKHTVSYAYLPNTLVFSIDGNLIKRINFTGSGRDCQKFGIGYNVAYQGTSIKGNIYSVRFYSRELAEEELKWNYNVDKTRFKF